MKKVQNGVEKELLENKLPLTTSVSIPFFCIISTCVSAEYIFFSILLPDGLGTGIIPELILWTTDNRQDSRLRFDLRIILSRPCDETSNLS